MGLKADAPSATVSATSALCSVCACVCMYMCVRACVRVRVCVCASRPYLQNSHARPSSHPVSRIPQHGSRHASWSRSAAPSRAAALRLPAGPAKVRLRTSSLHTSNASRQVLAHAARWGAKAQARVRAAGWTAPARGEGRRAGTPTEARGRTPASAASWAEIF